MGSLFRWIYCMNLPLLMVMIAAISVLFSLWHRRYQKKPWCKPVLGILFLVSIAAILAVTLMSRMEKAEAFVPSMIPFASYMEVLNGGNPEILRSNYMNVLLFYPSGFLAVLMLPRKWHPVPTILLVCFVFACLSAGIEYCQYAHALGQAEVDDVIHNALGALIGGMAGWYLIRRGL